MSEERVRFTDSRICEEFWSVEEEIVLPAEADRGSTAAAFVVRKANGGTQGLLSVPPLAARWSRSCRMPLAPHGYPPSPPLPSPSGGDKGTQLELKGRRLPQRRARLQRGLLCSRALGVGSQHLMAGGSRAPWTNPCPCRSRAWW